MQTMDMLFIAFSDGNYCMWPRNSEKTSILKHEYVHGNNRYH